MSHGFKFISSLKATQFNSTLAQHEAENEAIALPTDWVTAGIYKLIISEMIVQTDQTALDLELIFWRNGDYSSADMDANKVVARVTLAAVDATDQIAGAGPFYYANPLVQSIEYEDETHSGVIYCTLINRTATKKNTAASGTLQMTAGTSGDITSITVDGVELLSATVTWAVSIDNTIGLLETNIDAFTGTSGWSASNATDTLTLLAVDDDLLGNVTNGVVVATAETSDIAFGAAVIAGGTGQVVLTLGCTPYFS